MSRYSPSGTPSDDPRAQKTRQKLKQALVEVLADKEFPEITVNDLTRQAEINRATFYSHYADKQQLLDNLVSETFSQMMIAYTSGKTSLEDDNLQEFIKSSWEYVGFFSGSVGGGISDSFTAAIRGEVVRQLEVIITTWLETDSTDKSNSQTLISGIAGAIFNTGANWARESNQNQLEEHSQTLRNLMIHGLKHARFSGRDTIT
jgi:AcrR family transcriptional regulator